MNPDYPTVAQRADHRCEYCRAPETIFNSLFEVEHIVPTSKGGQNYFDNLALACRACNLAKSDHLDGYDPEMQSRIPLFHPRKDTWKDITKLTWKRGCSLP